MRSEGKGDSGFKGLDRDLKGIRVLAKEELGDKVEKERRRAKKRRD